MIEKRLIDRFELNLLVRLTSGSTVIDNISTRDISAKGVYLFGNHTFSVNSTVNLEIFVSNLNNQERKIHESLLSTTGRVVRTSQHGMAVEFNKRCKINALSSPEVH